MKRRIAWHIQGWIFERRPLVLGWASTLARRASRLQHLDLSGLATHVGDEQVSALMSFETHSHSRREASTTSK